MGIEKIFLKLRVLSLASDALAECAQPPEQYTVNWGMQTLNAFVIVVATADQFGLQVDVHKLLRTSIGATKLQVLSGFVVHIGRRSRRTYGLDSLVYERVYSIRAWEIRWRVDVPHTGCLKHRPRVLNRVPSSVAATTRVGTPGGPNGKMMGMVLNGVTRHLLPLSDQ